MKSKFPYSWKHYLYKWKKIKPSLEAEYTISKVPRQSSVLKLLIWIAFIQAVLTLALSPKNRSDKVYLSLRIVEFVVLIMIYIVHLRTKRGCEYFILFVNSSLFVILSEYLKKNIDDGERLPLFMLGLLIEIQALSMIISKVESLKCISFIFITNIICATRYLPINENPESKFFPIIHVVVNTILMSLVSYVNEVNDRVTFYADKEKNFSLSCFKELITDVFPSPIIVINKEKILFANEEALNTLACKETSEILKKFENIIIESTPETLMNVFHEPSSEEGAQKNVKSKTSLMNYGKEVEKSVLKYMKEMDKISMHEKKTLSDLLNMRNTHLTAMKKYYKVILGYNNFGNPMIPIYFDIKITNVVWEENEATMIILSENRTIQEINMLKKESLYKDNLLATVSHDLRTPLNGIIGILNQAAEAITEAGLKKTLTVALRSAKYLLFMINDILDFHQISNGKLGLNFEYFSLWDVIHETSKLIKFQAKLKGLRFITENKLSGLNSRAYIRSDPNRVKQVILNLLGNALKFTSHGSIKISLEDVENCGEDNIPPNKEDFALNNINASFKNMFLIKVTDTGTGIKKEDQHRLFKLFGKIENKINNKLNKSGIGLGLSISQNIVKVLNGNMKDGEIKVQSEPEKGSCFYFPLRYNIDCMDEENFSLEWRDSHINEIYVRKEGRITRKHEPPKETNNDLSLIRGRSENNVSLLIVDDDQINLLVAASYLKNEENFKFETACNGLQALEKIKVNAKESRFFDIILMDCNMPMMDGFEATKIIRDLINSNLIPDVIIIACTANTSPSDIEVCNKSGMNGFIAKPFSKIEMFSVLMKYQKKNL